MTAAGGVKLAIVAAILSVAVPACSMMQGSDRVSSAPKGGSAAGAGFAGRTAADRRLARFGAENPEGRPEHGDLRPVAGRELEALLSNAGVQPALSLEPGAIQIRVPFGEYFEADGSYTIRVEQAAVRGTYTIRGPSLCVQVPGWPTRCRRIFRNPRGLYFTSYDDSPGRLAEITVRH